MSPRVELIHGADCPNVPATRAALLRAFAQARVPPTWAEWEHGDPEAPPYAREYGSPTILVNGRDVAPAEQANAGPCCRLYACGDGAARGAPPVNAIASALHDASVKSGWPMLIAALPGAAATILPACPLCWPLYAGILSALGLGFLLDARRLPPFAGTLLLFALAPLAWSAYHRRAPGPLLAGALGAALILTGKFVWSSLVFQFGGLTIVLGASLWNILPRKSRNCARCESP